MIETQTLPDSDLYDAARSAARAHDTARFGPLLDEIERRRLNVDLTALFNELWPPRWRGRYTAVRPPNAPKARARR